MIVYDNELCIGNHWETLPQVEMAVTTNHKMCSIFNTGYLAIKMLMWSSGQA